MLIIKAGLLARILTEDDTTKRRNNVADIPRMALSKGKSYKREDDTRVGIHFYTGILIINMWTAR